MTKLNQYETEAKSFISAKPMLGLAIGIVIGFILHALLF
jgi:ElaB/YqjD/DUF883 family membrane-anchored ribosome-binding protein